MCSGRQPARSRHEALHVYVRGTRSRGLSEEWRNEARDEAALLASMAAFVRDEGGVLLVDSKYIEDSPNMRVVAERSASGVKPSVPRPSLRIVASALHTMEDIDLLMKYLGHAVDEFLR